MASIDSIRNSVMSTQAQNSSTISSGIKTRSVSGMEADTVGDFEMPDQVTSIVEETTQTSGETMQEETSEQSEEQIAKQNEKLRKSVEQLNKSLPDSEVLFGYHEKTHRVTLKIVDKDTKKVIRELPPEETLDMIAKVWEMAGILVDEKR